MDLSLIVRCEQGPSLVKAVALVPAACGEDGLRAEPPAHPAEFEALRDEGLAGSFHEAGADRESSCLQAGVVHPMSVLAEVDRTAPDVLGTRVLLTQVIQRANDAAHASGLVAENLAQLLVAVACLGRPVAVGCRHGSVQVLAGVE